MTRYDSYILVLQGPGGRRRRASTGAAIGPGRHPPSEVGVGLITTKMRMRLPVHVWAMLSRGKEAESCEGKRAVRCWWAFDLG